ncbi:MAG TPA: hypothetical protein VFO10_22325 [Oligoflexus sp.]|uniref:hypothetical protein n=1 Tax=Oligoflexus sp. TaxID=1971216 RepID=UPI002D7E56FA|nr:hypothetical protein [Oligoflexus sp.]HET9240015.1 hypothetical protein [Oligoflexus sp.]
MAKAWMTSFSIMFSGLACTEQSSDYRGRSVQETSPAGELDVSEKQTQGSDAPTSGTTPKATPTPGATPAPAPLNEAQALALVRGSCIFAGCHADATTVMASPNILMQVKDSLMPPPTQQRYTLRPADRAALVAYLENRNAGALVD